MKINKTFNLEFQFSEAAAYFFYCAAVRTSNEKDLVRKLKQIDNIIGLNMSDPDLLSALKGKNIFEKVKSVDYSKCDFESQLVNQVELYTLAFASDRRLSEADANQIFLILNMESKIYIDRDKDWYLLATEDGQVRMVVAENGQTSGVEVSNG